MAAIEFDDEAQWDGEELIFWANREAERIRCKIGRKSINGLPGFTHASRQEISMRKAELVALIKPSASKMILAGQYDPHLTIKTVQMYWEDKGL